MAENTPRIIVEHHGPYRVVGGAPLSRKAPVTSEHGEPLTWQKTRTYNLHGNYALCRCGKSANKPFCDDAHESSGFDGTETADATDFADRAKNYQGTGIVVKDDRALCTHAGFCGSRATNVWRMTRQTEDTAVRAQVIAMVERCPSGALTYSISEGGPDVEPDLTRGIAVTPRRTSVGDWRHSHRAGRRTAFGGPEPGHPVPLRRFQDQATLRRGPHRDRLQGGVVSGGCHKKAETSVPVTWGKAKLTR